MLNSTSGRYIYLFHVQNTYSAAIDALDQVWKVVDLLLTLTSAKVTMKDDVFVE